MISSLVSYVGEPLIAAAKIGAFGIVKCRGIEKFATPPTPIDEARTLLNPKKLEKVDEKKYKLVDYPWPEGFVAKMEDFIKEIGLDPKFIILGVYNAENSPCATLNSIKLHGYARLLLSEKMINEIAVEFTDEHKFIIAHELGHVFHNDSADGIMRKTVIGNVGSLAAYAVTAAAFSPISLMGMVATHLTACGVAKLSSWWFSNREQCRQEFAADRFAASKSIKLAKGGIAYFTREQQGNHSLIASYIKKNEEKIKDAKGGCERWTYRVLMPKMYNCIISPEGDERLDFKHPPYSVRKAVIASIITKSFSQDDKNGIPAK